MTARTALVTISAMAFAAGAMAQPVLPSAPPSREAPSATNWTFDVGPGVLWLPRYEGARERRVLPIPAIELRYQRDRFFVSAREGIGATLLDVAGFKVGPVLRFSFGRDESDSAYLRGLGDVPFTVEGGVSVKYEFGPYAGLQVEARRGLGGHNGWVIDAGADGRIRLGAVAVSAGPRLSLADGTYNRAFFGVDAGQAARSGYARYEPGFGLRSVGASASARWSISERITAIAFFNYGRLVGEAGPSPIVNGPGGQRDQFTLGSAITYRFAW